MATLIRKEDREYLKGEFDKYLKNDVDLVVFTSNDENCRYCKETVQLATEVSEINPKIHLKVYNFDEDKDQVKAYGVEKYPATIVSKAGVEDGRIVYYGLPSGYEFGSLIEDLKNVSVGDADVSSKAAELISKIDKPITIKVYVTPTCPYCPRAVGTAHKFALMNPNIKGEMIEALEFENEAEEVGVSSVPHIVINNDVTFIGAYPDDQFAEYVMEAYDHQ
ncbi:thioredoxin/glutaredoxin [Thermoplasma volcanium GSS1]|uniref:Thioredoxin/glutaredoxin n=1 Tax=Thermoplasma volcanium (strain ATCC 51530 / DSM 4299 / JCM 9571 / NBRC 15438 / GSS1) TaxID=273116 RepID=Q97CA1_THEVO|nr:thioredoxin family protein [Thermoplasma volcanium]BAB59344.1 thioredoxin/glutaredoxin [Thermoplasma volcanium GSS1]